MPRFKLQFKCELTGITNLICTNNRFSISIQCGCGYIHDNLWIDKTERLQIPNSRGSANVVLHCKGCERLCTIDLVEEKDSKFYQLSGTWHDFLTLECRGTTPVGWKCTDGWEAQGFNTSSKFEIELEDGDFYDSDEKNNYSNVSVTEFDSRVVPTK